MASKINTGNRKWLGIDSSLAKYIEESREQTIETYKIRPSYIKEHASIESSVIHGGYTHRQLHELIQNGADSLIHSRSAGNIKILLTDDTLYCANQGVPIDHDGVESILQSHISPRKGNEIGRFGLGFKSVLEVSESPLFYSRSVSFGFFPDKTESRLIEITPEVTDFPKLRVAYAIDPIDSAEKDDNLEEMFKWADTIIKLPLLPDTGWLAEVMFDFREEFLLFCPHVKELVFINARNNTERKMTLENNNGILVLSDGDKKTNWQVFKTWHKPSEEAKKEAGEQIYRNEVPILWALPLKTTTKVGEFWAFFPTQDSTKVKGIINAPWKTDGDRLSLLEGKYNQELIEKASHLIVDNIPNIGNPEDKEDAGYYLDILPGRGAETDNWADWHINSLIYKRAAAKASIPNTEGLLCNPKALKLKPPDIPDEAVNNWMSFNDHPVDWCHNSINSRDRYARVKRLIEHVGNKISGYSDWLEALLDADNPSPEASIAATIAAGILYTDPDSSNETQQRVIRSKIVLDSTGKFVELDKDRIFIGGDFLLESSNLNCIHPDIITNDLALSALKNFGIRRADSSAEFKQLCKKQSFDSMSEKEWVYFWNLVKTLDFSKAFEIISANTHGSAKSKIKVQTKSGKFKSINRVLLPGKIVPENCDSENSVAIDMDYHQDDLNLLKLLGAVENVGPKYHEISDTCLDDYRREQYNKYYEELTVKLSKPSISYLEFNQKKTIGPLLPIYNLSEEGKARFSFQVLGFCMSDEPWILQHHRNANYPKISCIPPSLWFIIKNGRWFTSMGIKPIDQCIGPSLNCFSKVMPVVERMEDGAAEKLGIPISLSDLGKEHWNRALKEIDVCNDIFQIGDFYRISCKYISSPTRIRCIKAGLLQNEQPNRVVAIFDKSNITMMDKIDQPYILVGEKSFAEELCNKWGLQSRQSLVKTKIHAVPSGLATFISDKFFGLGPKLIENEKNMLIEPCSYLSMEVTTGEGTENEESIILKGKDRVYFLDQIDDEELFDKLLILLGIQLDRDVRQAILDNRLKSKARSLVVKIRQKDKISEKVLTAIGKEALLRNLPKGLIKAASEIYGDFKEDGLRIADLALSVHGIEILKAFKEDLRQHGLNPPEQWTGGHRTRFWVQELDFPVEYAGFQQKKLENVIEVEGPSTLPPLHDFQIKVVNRIRELLVSDKRKRGLLSLPTGAGKTRVAIESLINAIKDGDITNRILWITQSQELCEQAVQTWKDLWRAIGSQNPLYISRHWANNYADMQDDNPQVIIATVDKLQNSVDDHDYKWLSNPACVVIDEAHSATTSEYIRVLNWLGLSTGKDARPLIGLTATPFRTGEDQTTRLVRKFFAYRFDEGVLGDDPYGELQKIRVLAKVDHLPLEGTTIDILPTERDEFNQFKDIPKAAMQRLGNNVSRNEEILHSVKKMDKSWQIILFACSVSHAQTIAALLNDVGISAASISQNTDSGARRYYIEKFRKQKLRVLTNYGVLAAGFDAPKVRAVFVTRPTFSPGVYQQMIGRGLRGPLNGGEERCTIVNIKDNVEQFGEKLAFTKFEKLW